MATAPQVVDSELQQLARKHLWMHFSRMGAYSADHEIPLITRADGCYVYDEHGNRYLDGLSALFCVNAGHGRGAPPARPAAASTTSAATATWTASRRSSASTPVTAAPSTARPPRARSK